MTDLYVNEDRPVQNVFSLTTKVVECPKLKRFIWNNARGKRTNITFNDKIFWNNRNVVDFRILHPEVFSFIDNHMLSDCIRMTNDFIFPKVTRIGVEVCKNNPNVQYAYIPCISNVNDATFSLASTETSHVISKNLGLKKLCIGDNVTNIGKNTFYGHENLHTIEFATDSENWIDTWNNNTTISNWIGAAKGTANPNEAILIPQVGADGVYYTGSRRIGSNASITIRILKVEKTN